VTQSGDSLTYETGPDGFAAPKSATLLSVGTSSLITAIASYDIATNAVITV